MLNMRSRVVREPSRHAPRGLTLLELVVVITILVTLAGIVVPQLSNMLIRSHTASGATNVGELTKALETYQILNYHYPDGYDSLLLGDEDGTPAPQLLWMSSTSKFNNKLVSTYFTPYEVTANGLKSLNNAGITSIYNMLDLTAAANADKSATFPGTTGTPTPIIEGTKLLQVDPVFMAAQLGNGTYDPATDASAKYVVLGIGANCSMVGARKGGVAEAPVRGVPGDNADLNTTYGRYVAIFKLDETSGGAAVMVACACPGGNGLGSTDFLLQRYYKDVAQ